MNKLKIYIDGGRESNNPLRLSLWKMKQGLRFLYLMTPYKQRTSMIIHSNKAIYFNIPKVATSTIGSLIYEQVYNKNISSYYDSFDGFPQLKEIDLKSNWFKEYFKFAFVRNPYSRVVSCYKTKNILSALGISRDSTFKEFILCLMNKTDKELSKIDPHIRPQYMYLYKEGRLLVDYIAKVEDINYELNYIFFRIGFGKVNKVPHLNKRAEKDEYKEFYDKETIKLVGERYKKDIKLFGYKFK